MVRRSWLGVLLLVAGCDLFGSRLAGDWDIEVIDAERCGMEVELEGSKDDVEGEGEIDCRIYFEGSYYYDIVNDDAEVEGDLDGDAFELEVTFYDDFFEEELSSTLEGEVDGDEMSGDIYIEGEWFGEFEGER